MIKPEEIFTIYCRRNVFFMRFILLLVSYASRRFRLFLFSMRDSFYCVFLCNRTFDLFVSNGIKRTINYYNIDVSKVNTNWVVI